MIEPSPPHQWNGRAAHPSSAASNRLQVLRVPDPFAHSAKDAWQRVKADIRFPRTLDLTVLALSASPQLFPFCNW